MVSITSTAIAPPLSIYEKDHIAFCIMDVLLLLLNFGIGYWLLAKNAKFITTSLKRVLIGFYILLIIQAILSAAMLVLMLNHKDEKT